MASRHSRAATLAPAAGQRWRRHVALKQQPGEPSVKALLPEPSPWPNSSAPPLKEVECCSPLAWCLKMEEDSSSSVQPSR